MQDLRFAVHSLRHAPTVIIVTILLLAPALLLAQNTVAGEWLLTQDVYGNPLHQRLSLMLDGTVLSGTLSRR